MSNLTPYQRIAAAQKANNIRILHEYYEAHPGCTMKKAELHTDISMYLIQIYSKLRHQYINDSSITAQINLRYPPRATYGGTDGQDDITLAQV